MRLLIYFLGFLFLPYFAQAYIGPGDSGPGKPNNNNSNTKPDRVQYRSDCAEGISQIDLDVNNVRARLLIGGDVWWDNETNGRYIVPKVDPASGQPEVSSLFAGAVWIGGFDDGGSLKMAAQTYGTGSQRDFWPGPLDEDGLTDTETCQNWDRFFRVKGTSIDLHIQNYLEAKAAGVAYEISDIPEDILAWPARGNANFFEIYGFELPANQQLAPFHEPDIQNGVYEPELGDYPVIQIRGCSAMPQYPDDMIFWVYNDAGNIHTETQGSAIGMEIQVQAFGYSRNDELNDMTFMRYKLVNKAAIESIDQTFFAMWVDPDLGCYVDDYIGCDTSRSLAYVYNSDALDGNATCGDCEGVATYCQNIPMIGIDYFRGPLNEDAEEIGMSSFTYYNNRLLNPAPGTDDPNNAIEFYNYISGRWRDGTPFTYGGTGYNLNSVDYINYAFTEAPDDAAGWSMCSQSLDEGDRRTLQASGPFRLDPGASNELIIGVPWVPDIAHPCPDIKSLLRADDLAQGLFDACFKLTRGPDAPDLDWVELDKELVGVISNDRRWNNFGESYSVVDFQAPAGLSEEERSYVFEGYKVFQLVGPNVSRSELDNPAKARLIYQVDLENGVDEVFNWFSIDNPNARPGDPTEIWVPESKVEGSDRGVRHTFKIEEDQFADADRRLVNHKKYYYTIIAYGYNNYEDFRQEGELLFGQPRPYIESDRNIRTYTVIPRPIVDEVIYAEYGDGVEITRIEGEGAGSNFLAISKETREELCERAENGEVTYLPGAGPIDVKIYNPLEVIDGEYELTFYDEDMTNLQLDDEVNWRLSKLGTNEVIESESTIDQLNEQLIAQYGFSVSIRQTAESGDQTNRSNGGIGMDVSYEDPNGTPWLTALFDEDAGSDPQRNFIKTGFGEIDENRDLEEALSRLGNRFFTPYTLGDFRYSLDLPAYVTPTMMDPFSESIRGLNLLSNLNNVDIVLTADKSKWSRCPIVETANRYYYDQSPGLGIPTEGGARHLDLRQAPSVGKEDLDGDGLPDPDGDGIGMGWFPGYAIDVETGERLNIFFGENSTYDGSLFPGAYDGQATGRDMMWNPSGQERLITTASSVYDNILGGQHFIYVTRLPYDEGALLRQYLAGRPNQKRFGLRDVTWTGLLYLQQGEFLNSYQEGLIPNDAYIRCRVDNQYAVKEANGSRNGYPTYLFKIEGAEPTPLASNVEINEALNAINVVPNPYYGFSDYEVSQFSNIVKITNLPAKCTINIYTLDGKHIRTYQRNEQGVDQSVGRSNPGVLVNQYDAAVEWDLKNRKGIPVASGVYLIHVDAPGLGERVIKWFGVARQFDPSGL